MNNLKLFESSISKLKSYFNPFFFYVGPTSGGPTTWSNYVETSVENFVSIQENLSHSKLGSKLSKFQI